MTRSTLRALKRIEDIKRLCAARQKAFDASKWGRMKEIDCELVPLVCEQLKYERRLDRKRTADEWQDFPSEAYGDAR